MNYRVKEKMQIIMNKGHNKRKRGTSRFIQTKLNFKKVTD